MGELKRFDFEMNGDDPQTVEAPDGEWVRFDDARAEVESLAAANALLALIRREAESVNGKYAHPDQLEQAVCGAFDRIRDALAAQPATAHRYALNFCSMCGGRLDCEECKEADARPPVDPNDLVGVTAMHTASQYKPPLPPLALVEDRTPEQLAADGDEP